jgi:hypothetical protein
MSAAGRPSPPTATARGAAAAAAVAAATDGSFDVPVMMGVVGRLSPRREFDMWYTQYNIPTRKKNGKDKSPNLSIALLPAAFVPSRDSHRQLIESKGLVVTTRAVESQQPSEEVRWNCNRKLQGGTFAKYGDYITAVYENLP